MNEGNRARLRSAAATAAATDDLLGRASAASLFSKVSAIEACKANPFQPSLVWHPTIFGSMMQLDLRETVAQQIYLTGGFEPDLLWLFTCLVDEGMSVIDGGAHIGFFSLALGQLVGPGGRVDAFEPMPSTKLHLDTNIRNAGLKNVFTHTLALWNESSVVPFRDLGHALSAYNSITAPRLPAHVKVPEGSMHQLPATSLDSFVEHSAIKPALVKLDVESAEYQVITGMKKVLAKYQPIVVLEIGDFENTKAVSSYQTMQLLADASYCLYFIANCRLTPLQLESRRYDFGNILAVPIGRTEEVLARTSSVAVL